MRVFIGIPLYTDFTCNPGAVQACIRTSGLDNIADVTFLPYASSILTKAFNHLWASAVAGSFDYFVMLHSDIVPESGWAKKLLGILREHGADVVSAASPIKNEKGILSCGIGDPANPWVPLFRFTARQMAVMPESFTAEDVGWRGYPLLVNTGCWIADLQKPWCRETDEDGCFKAHFDFRNRIRYDAATGQAMVQTESEDWLFSRTLFEMGVKVMLTRAVKLVHWGTYRWASDAIWGEPVDGLLNRAHARAQYLAAAEQGIGPTGAWLDKNPEGHLFDKPLADAIARFIIDSGPGPDAAILDLGCGQGKYVRNFRDAGLDAVGVDGNPATDAIPFCAVGDLADPALALPCVDWVVSLEVGEHIPAEFEETYFDHLDRADADTVVLSWAVPGQPGRGHVNCRQNDYVIAKMAERGFLYEPKATESLRDAASLDYFKNTLMVFRSSQEAIRLYRPAEGEV